MSLIDPRLISYLKEQGQAQKSSELQRRIAQAERNAGAAAGAVFTQLQAQVTAVEGDVTDLATATDNALLLKLGLKAWLAGAEMVYNVNFVTFGGGSTTATASVTHGLGRTPLVVLCTSMSQTGAGPTSAQLFDYPTSTSLTLLISTGPPGSFQPGAGIGVPVSWVAIG